MHLICRQADMVFLSAQSQMLSSKAFKALIIYFKLSNPPTNPLPQEEPAVMQVGEYSQLTALTTTHFSPALPDTSSNC